MTLESLIDLPLTTELGHKTKPRSLSVQSNGVFGGSETILNPLFPLGVDTGYWIPVTGCSEAKIPSSAGILNAKYSMLGDKT